MRAKWPVYLLVALLAVSVTWGIGQARARRRMETALEAERHRALADLADGISNVEVLLGKGLVLSSPLQSAAIFPELWHQANAALSNLARLPLPVLETQRTSRFLKQTADIAYVIGKKVGRGDPIGDSDWELMNSLRGQAAKLGEQVRALQVSALKQGFTWSRGPSRSAGPSQAAVTTIDVNDGFRGIEKEMDRYPALVYDGPFSDHIERRQPAGVTGKAVTPEEAIAKAVAFVPSPPGVTYTARVRNEATGKIPAYSIQVTPQGGAGPEYFLDISRTGGHVVWMSSNRLAGPAVLSLDQARQRAIDFLASRGYASLEATYAVKEDNRAFVLFVHKENGVRVYSDLIKVQVSLDTGEISGFEALGYLMSHVPRNMPAPRVSAAEARKRLSPRLTVVQERLALIPLENLTEVLAHEFRVRLGATDFLVYINALTGDEEKIMQIIPSGGGELAL
ncbi:MAG: germination protein YpeB [Ignavibacteriales bacterium]